MEVFAPFEKPTGTKWDKIERYANAEKLQRMLNNKYRDPKEHQPKYMVNRTDSEIWVKSGC